MNDVAQGERFDPTDEQRRLVRMMAGCGIPQADIAKYLRIDVKTLRKHLRDEIDMGSIEATTKVAQSLFRMATEGKNTAAAIFWMKARAGWREKHDIEISGKDGSAITGIGIVTNDPVEASRVYQRLMRGTEDLPNEE
ncbi:MAG: hypothetical protein JWR10_126 [Rubritepida sp.]|nr:hypothetical protein [Rubritepida sp.]